MNACYRPLSRRRAWARQVLGASSGSTLTSGFLAILLSMPISAGSITYAYDVLGRLTTATYSTGVVITYSYDASGNRTSVVTTGAP